MILREPANRLDPRVRRLWRLEWFLVVLALLAGLVIAVVILAATGATVAAIAVGVVGGLVVVVGGGAAVLLAPRVAYDHYGYEVTELGLYVASGIVRRRWQVVPHARAQTVDITAGPLERLCGVVSVAVSTASADGGTEVPGLAPPVADALVDELARRAGIEEGT